MKILFYSLLSILVLLAVSSGVSKILLMPQEVAFFGQHGFNNSLLIIFGLCQLIGGVLFAIPKTRVIGAVLVGVTFLISAMVLVQSGNIPMALVTLLFTGLVGFIVKFDTNAKF